jgi:hypothetical protein
MAKQKRGSNNGGNNGGSGGGRNNGGGNDDDGDDDDDGDEEFTEKQLGRITNIVNAAVSGQMSRKLPRLIADAVGSAMKGSRRRDDEEDQPDGDEDAGSGDDDQDQEPQQPSRGKRGAAPSKPDPAMTRMSRELAQLKKERQLEREQARNRERDTLLREQLEAAGVDKNRIRGAVAIHASNMKYDEKAGTWSYKTKRDGFDEDVDVEVGIGDWAGTDEGKAFLAPPQGQGQPRGGSGHRPVVSGAGGPTPRLRGNGAPSKDPKAAKQEARAQAMQNLGNAINELGGATVAVGGTGQ